MQLSIDKNSSIPIYMQIKNQIRDMILSGNLPENFRLPPERKLAVSLNVNRSTVLNAYRELKADGLIDSRIGQGTVVISQSEEKKSNSFEIEPEALPWRQLFNESASLTREPLIRDLLALTNRADVISFAAGIAVPQLDPVEAINSIQSKLVEEYGGAIFQHTPTEGLYSLRESISRLIGKRGITASPEEIMVLSGSQQGIDLAARIFIDPGDIVIVEEPSFFSALQIFKSAGARIIGVPVDEKGMKTDYLEILLERHRAKLIYTIPTFQNPSSIVMDIKRRKQLLNIAYRYRVPILEDDAYGELRYRGDKLPSLKALDHHGYVIYLSTFSKYMSPGFRIGYMAAPRQVIRQFALTKQMADLHANSTAQWTMDRIIKQGLLNEHIEKVKKENSVRMEVMIKALEKYAAHVLEWNIPEGGLYIWCRLKKEINMKRLLEKSAEYRIAFVPGDAFYNGGQGSNYIRLNFTFPSMDKISEGIKRLVKAIEESFEMRFEYYGEGRLEIKPII